MIYLFTKKGQLRSESLLVISLAVKLLIYFQALHWNMRCEVPTVSHGSFEEGDQYINNSHV